MARLEVIPTDFMRLNYEFHHDNYSKGEHYGEVTFEVPFSVGNLVTGKNPFTGIGDVFVGSQKLPERMVEPTRRDVDVKVIVNNDNDNIPSGGEEIEDVVFVSETGSDVSGDGTVNNPYATISHALASDPRILAGACRTIHVMNSSAVAVIADNPTLNIADFLLWGSGVNHPDYPVSNMPFIGHPTINDALTLDAANSTVTGLGFDVNGSDYCINILNGAGGRGIKITSNLFEMSRAGDAFGIYADIGTGIGTEDNPILIANNSFNIESTGGEAGGIYLNVNSSDDIYATIIGNDMSNSITGYNNAFGISLSVFSINGNIGSKTRPVLISGNKIAVTSNYSGAWGINSYILRDGDIYAVITGNDMSKGIKGDVISLGICLDTPYGSVGSEERPVIISGNTMTATSTGIPYDAFGIHITSGNYTYATITGNDMSGGISGYDYVSGIYIRSFNDSIGSETRPVIIAGNPMTVTSIGGEAYEISLRTDNRNIFAKIIGNDMSNTITGDSYACGIYIDSMESIGSETRPLIVSGNPMTVTSDGLNAVGMVLRADRDIFAKILGNDMSKGISGDYATGICLRSFNGNIGSETNPVIISGNPMFVTADVYDAYGIFIDTFGTDKSIFAAITGNDMSNSIWGDDNAYGIYLRSWGGSVGSETRPLIISGNPMAVTSDNLNAYGIYLEADEDIFTAITGNDLSNTIAAGLMACGVHLQSYSGYIGSETNPVVIAGNPMTVTSLDEAVGIGIEGDLDVFGIIKDNIMDVSGVNLTGGIGIASYSGSIGSAISQFIIYNNSITASSTNDDVGAVGMDAANNVFTTIKRNYMNLTSGTADAAGAYIVAGGLIGDVTSLATYFINNYGTITGGNDDFILYLTTGTPTGGNYVIWGGNSFTTVGNWDGNHGPNNEVHLDFPWVAPDVIYP